MLPPLRITELLAEMHGWTGFAERFFHLRTERLSRALLPNCAPRVRFISDDLLAHVAPLGWEHITFNGDYIWPTEPLQHGFRPLRNPRSAFLDAA
jgi:hypothetical protein